MARFRYVGFDPSGARVSGVVESERVELARDDLRGRGVLVSELVAESAGRDWRESLGLQSDEVRLDDLEFLTAELSLLLDSGVRIDRAIGILQRTGRSGAVGRLLGELATELKQGRQLSEAAAGRPDAFDPLYVNLILAAAIFRVPIKRICLVQFPFTVLAAATGLVVLLRHVPYLPPESEPRRNAKDVVRVFWSIWPIFLTILLIFVFKLNMLLALGIAAVLTQAASRLTASSFRTTPATTTAFTAERTATGSMAVTGRPRKRA